MQLQTKPGNTVMLTDVKLSALNPTLNLSLLLSFITFFSTLEAVYLDVGFGEI